MGLVALALTGQVSSTKADTILVFGQNGTTNTVTATNPTSTTTHIVTGAGPTASFIGITITAMENTSGTTAAFLRLTADSVGAETNDGSQNTQSFTGSFSINSNNTGTGTNYLSGTFTDAVFGIGNGLTLTASSASPGQAVVFTSAGPITTLGPPRSISLAFTNVLPAVPLGNTTIPAFTASVSGNFSAFATTAAPEPGSIAMAFGGLPILGLLWARRRQQARM